MALSQTGEKRRGGDPTQVSMRKSPGTRVKAWGDAPRTTLQTSISSGAEKQQETMQAKSESEQVGDTEFRKELSQKLFQIHS